MRPSKKTSRNFHQPQSEAGTWLRPFVCSTEWVPGKRFHVRSPVVRAPLRQGKVRSESQQREGAVANFLIEQGWFLMGVMTLLENTAMELRLVYILRREP